jgi:hypothetical protein
MRWLYLFASCWLLAVAGCASSAVVKEASAVSTSAPVSLDFVWVVTSSALTDMATNDEMLNEKIITGLRETQMFGTVSGDVADLTGSGIKIKAAITELKPVSDDARVWFGGLAGRARVVVQVTVSDLNSGKPIQAFQVAGESGATARSGTTNEAIQQAAQQIVFEVVKMSSQTSQ